MRRLPTRALPLLLTLILAAGCVAPWTATTSCPPLPPAAGTTEPGTWTTSGGDQPTRATFPTYSR